MALNSLVTQRFEHLLTEAQREGRVPALVAGVVRDGQLAWFGGAGLVGETAPDPDTQFRMGSITKTFVAVAILRLRDAGALDLGDRIEHHLPEVAGSGLGSVTVEQLLSHGAGLQAETPGPWWERTPGGSWEELLASGIGLRFRSGRRFHYTNVGYAVLGRLLEVAHRRPWFDLVRGDLLDPLGMTRTTVRPQGRAATGYAVHPLADVVLTEPEHDAGAMAPAGQLWTTANDLARWASFLAGRTDGVLAPETLAEMCEPHTVHDEPGMPWTGAHGLGWEVWNQAGVRYAGHGGSMPGFLAGLRVRLDRGDGVFAMMNATASPRARPLIGHLHEALAELDPPVEAGWRPTGEVDDLDFVGTWHWGPAPMTVRAVGGQLVFGEPGQGRGSRFAPTGPDTWVGLDGYFTGEPLRAIRGTDSRVSHYDLASFRVTREPYEPAADIPGGLASDGWHRL